MKSRLHVHVPTGPHWLYSWKNRACIHCISFFLLSGYRNSAPLWSLILPYQESRVPTSTTSYHLILPNYWQGGLEDSGVEVHASTGPHWQWERWSSRVLIGTNLHCLILPYCCLVGESLTLCLAQLRTIWWGNQSTICCCQRVEIWLCIQSPWYQGGRRNSFSTSI